MEEKAIRLILKQREQCHTQEVLAAIEEQKRLSRAKNDKRNAFYKVEEQAIKLLKVGTEKFFEKFPEYKEDFSKGETKLDVIGNAINFTLNNPQKFAEINDRMKEIDELRKHDALLPVLSKALHEYMVAFSNFEVKLKEDRNNLFSSEYKKKMSEYANEGVLLYYLETPDLPLLDNDINSNDILDSFCWENCLEARMLFLPLLQMGNPGISMKRKQEDICITIELINNGFYRSAARNLFSLLDSEHKKAANTYEGIIKKKEIYKKGAQRSRKIDQLIENQEDFWMETAWDKINKYYAKVVSSNPVKGVIHRNSIVHGDYNSKLVDVDRYSIIKLLLLFLNLRLIADQLCVKEEILNNLLLYLPSLIANGYKYD